MKKAFFGPLLILVVVISCNSSSSENMEACSVKIPGIEFTRSLNDAKATSSVSDGKLILKSKAKSDHFNDPDGKTLNNTAPVLLTKIDNTKPFTFSARISPTFLSTYDAGAMYIYLSNRSWFKFAFEQDEQGRTRIVTVRTNETSDDNNHDVVNNAGVYMKISSDTKSIGFYYSLDKTTWQLVRLFRNEYPAETWLGLSSQSPAGNGTSATFEECSIIPSAIKDFRTGL